MANFQAAKQRYRDIQYLSGRIDPASCAARDTHRQQNAQCRQHQTASLSTQSQKHPTRPVKLETDARARAGPSEAGPRPAQATKDNATRPPRPLSIVEAAVELPPSDSETDGRIDNSFEPVARTMRLLHPKTMDDAPLDELPKLANYNQYKSIGLAQEQLHRLNES